LPTYKINQLDMKTKDWKDSRSLVASGFMGALQIALASFAGMRTRKTADGFTVKQAGVRVVITEDRSATR